MNSRQQFRALLLANLAAALGLNLLMFCMNEGHSKDFGELNVNVAESGERQSGDIAELSERLARIETLLQYIVPRPADPPDAGL